MTRVPITGIGVIAPDAVGVAAFRSLLASGASAIRDIDRFDTSDLSAHRAALVRDFKPRDFIAPMKMRRMNALSRLGVAAAKLAIEDSGATLSADTGVAIGTAFGPVQTSVDYLEEYLEKGASLAPPQLFAESVANAPGSHIAIEHGLRGFNVTITQRESSAMAAAMYAASQIVKGTVSAALIGGVDDVNEVLFSVLDRIGALSDDGHGLVLGEGSAVLVAGAGARKPYGWLAGFGIVRDNSASISDWGTDADCVVRAMNDALRDAETGSVDAIFVSANGSRGDAVEQRAIAQRFGAVETVRTKQIFGEYAAGGMLQIVAALLAVDEGRYDRVLVNSLSAGGGIVCAVITREGA
jgi:3-oxoacyl-(acyl-carrier-protein) synthase